ncbi:DUF2690 domain-containing protein [Streptomyces sp. WELS2]|uniref:DUF2690 domain-containing protein n=1 Tax=Streptomyces sp. WELS2 TaxID=2749435 RepID=UPI0015F05325|nr:DUF2690 domain-containing protein [Streptomyces sp. WELS2]
MTTANPDDNSTAPAGPGDNSTTPAGPGDNSSTPGDPPHPPWWKKWLSGPAALAYAVAVVGAVVTAVVTPVGDHVLNSLFDGPSCPGDGAACDGKNPQNQGCAEDAGTFKPTAGNPAHLQIRYSEDCEAVWAKITQGNPGDQVTISVTGGRTRTAEIAYDHDQFTHMVTVPDGEFRVTACAVPRPGGKSTFERYCIQATEATAWR